MCAEVWGKDSGADGLGSWWRWIERQGDVPGTWGTGGGWVLPGSSSPEAGLHSQHLSSLTLFLPVLVLRNARSSRVCAPRVLALEACDPFVLLS